MKRLRTWILIGITALFVSACEIVITPIPSPSLSNFSFYSTYQDSNGQSIVCDNRTTELYYEFDYGTTLNYWTSALIGATSDVVKGVETFSPQNVSGRERVKYTIPVGLSPLSTQSDELGTQSIIVVPAPKIIGYTELVIKAYGFNGLSKTYVIGTLPVVSGC